MINYAIDPEILKSRVPAGTELDTWNGTTYASLVGFNFLKTRVKGISIPFHTNFEEINLRFYVRRNDDGIWKRGVVFVKEIVPKPAIALIARVLYNENYEAMPTRHSIDEKNGLYARYEWKFKNRWNSIEVTSRGDSESLEEGSENQFIAEHFWGYSAQRNGSTKEYRVDHPSWRIWKASSYTVDVDVAGLYGDEFTRALEKDPISAFIADGSGVTVSDGKLLN